MGGAEAPTGALQRGSALLAQHRLEDARLRDLERRTYRRADWQICPRTSSDACQMRHMYSFNHNSNSCIRRMRLRGSLTDIAHNNSMLHYSILLVQSPKRFTLGSVRRRIEKSLVHGWKGHRCRYVGIDTATTVTKEVRFEVSQ